MSASERKIAELEEEVTRLRHLLKAQMQTGEQLEVEAIVNREGVPLVNLRWDQLATQQTPDEIRRLAHEMLRVCEWADTDATLLRALRAAGFADREVGGFMAMMREARGGSRESAAEAHA